MKINRIEPISFPSVMTTVSKIQKKSKIQSVEKNNLKSQANKNSFPKHFINHELLLPDELGKNINLLM